MASEKSPMADRNSTSALTPASAPTDVTIQRSRCQIHSPSGRASWTDSPASTFAAIVGRRAASVAGLPRSRTLMPAVCLGCVTDHVWSVEEIVALLA